MVSLLGFKMAGKPADDKHPFGHGRIEYIAGLIVSFIIVLMGWSLPKVPLIRSSTRKKSPFPG